MSGKPLSNYIPIGTIPVTGKAIKFTDNTYQIKCQRKFSLLVELVLSAVILPILY